MNQDLETPLMIAATSNGADIVEYLINNGASLNLVDSKSRSALHRACDSTNSLIALLLIDSGCDMSIRDVLGRTPLHISCQKGAMEIAQRICSSISIDILNIQDNIRGRTALHIAAENSDIDLIRLLARSNIDIKLKNKHGHTAKKIAINNRCKDVTALLNYLEENASQYVDRKRWSFGSGTFAGTFKAGIPSLFTRQEIYALIPMASTLNECEKKAHSVYSFVKSNYKDSEIKFIDENFLVSAKPKSEEVTRLLEVVFKYRSFILKEFDQPSSLYDGIIAEIDSHLTKDHYDFPRLMYWQSFVDFVHSNVNELADEDQHIGEAVQYLQLSGRLIYVEGDPDVICVEPNWLFNGIHRLLKGEDVIEDAVFEHAITSLSITFQYDDRIRVPSIDFGKVNFRSSLSTSLPDLCPYSITLRTEDDLTSPLSTVHSFLRMQTQIVSDFERIRFLPDKCIELEVDRMILAQIQLINFNEIVISVFGDNDPLGTLSRLCVYVWKIMRKLMPRLLINTFVNFNASSHSINVQTINSLNDLHSNDEVLFVQDTSMNINDLPPLARLIIAKRMDNPFYHDVLGGN
ncbi:hypothetical protein ACOME3_009970 [Neoechinorhynchus agilis]